MRGLRQNPPCFEKHTPSYFTKYKICDALLHPSRAPCVWVGTARSQGKRQQLCERSAALNSLQQSCGSADLLQHTMQYTPQHTLQQVAKRCHPRCNTSNAAGDGLARAQCGLSLSETRIVHVNMHAHTDVYAWCVVCAAHTG